ncbi:ABC transporter ATP-binding protein [Nocardioides perillae]|uniref:Putative ABC transport system ATP-binding protein n=1 Tax=Nocardioides perillae TaxID=1119534 RepID=A0A7Y9RRV9_9ACTN|nr:ABC transporter ATP-binding protein [Nocardioides perillae]NYG54259.1 putative ABC transport system ATP-binding protein [Nocardioides perillae]
MTQTQQGQPSGVLLEGRGLHKAYAASPALTGASLAVRSGEVVAVTGASGSGKSTLLLCLAGVVRPDAGVVTFGGRRLDDLDDDARTRMRRSSIGLVLQFGQLVPELSAVENVGLPLLLDGVARREAASAARHWLDRLGVADVADARPAQMSGGQAQRVAIARALVTSPRVVLADEPTGALDTVTAERTLDVLVEATRETGAALVVVTHDNRVAAAAEREVVLRDGATVGADLGARP